MKLLPKLAVFGCALAASTAMAADHADSPTLAADPTTDITDVFSWMDGSNVVLIMDVNPAATNASKFSNAALYTFHTSSTAKYGMAGTDTDIICQFDPTQKISCWVRSGGSTTDYVNGDASTTAGIKSASGKLKVFAGLRDDPFFFNLDGFKDAVADVESPPITTLQPAFTLDAAGCPTNVNAAMSTALVNDLKGTNHGAAAPVDHFAGNNVLSIVLSVDKSLLTTGGPIMSVWASTNKAM